MVSYKNILAHVHKWEGGLVYFPTEKQWTNRGVQWTTYKALAPKLLNIANPTLDGLKSMTQAQADKFIKYFWDKATYNNSITNQAAANAFFEMFWGGSKYGIKWLQRVLGVNPDGNVGPLTIAAANKYPPSKLIEEVKKRYVALAKADPSKYNYVLDGWINRWNSLLDISKKYFNQLVENLPKDIEGKKKSKIIIYLLGGLAVSYIIYKRMYKK